MKGGTLFSGIGAPECAAPWIHWRWSAEIDAFASAVLAHHFPGTPNLGDVTEIDAHATEPVDLIVFGSPCQSFSVAGKRAGLDDPRGNMALIGLQVVDRMRPDWVVFENVPGLLSSDEWRDFGTFLGALGECGYGFAYRVLDAQYAGVPQRRRRVFVVGYLGDWRPPAAVLFESESLSGHPAPSREAGKGIARPIASCPPGLRDMSAGSGSKEATLIAVQNATRGQDQNGLGISEDVMFTLDGASQHAIAFHATQDPIHSASALPLEASGGYQAIAFKPRARGDDGRNFEEQEDLAYALCDPGSGGRTQERNLLDPAMAVRRLTPRECERLQGFPDDFTLIWHNGKPAADGPRYRALGNAMAVPVIGWILSQIREFAEQ